MRLRYVAVLTACCLLSGTAPAKLPPPSEEAKAKAEEAKTKAAETAVKEAEALGKSQDAVAAKYLKGQKAKGGAAKPAAAAPAAKK